jgi:hypothetical protein
MPEVEFLEQFGRQTRDRMNSVTYVYSSLLSEIPKQSHPLI